MNRRSFLASLGAASIATLVPIRSMGRGSDPFPRVWLRPFWWRSGCDLLGPFILLECPHGNEWIATLVCDSSVKLPGDMSWAFDHVVRIEADGSYTATAGDPMMYLASMESYDWSHFQPAPEERKVYLPLPSWAEWKDSPGDRIVSWSGPSEVQGSWEKALGSLTKDGSRVRSAWASASPDGRVTFFFQL